MHRSKWTTRCTNCSLCVGRAETYSVFNTMFRTRGWYKPWTGHGNGICHSVQRSVKIKDYWKMGWERETGQRLVLQFHAKTLWAIITYPPNFSKSRAKITNESVLTKFYDAIEPIVTDNGVSHTPEIIFNCDESGIPLDFTPHKVIAAKIAQSLWSLNSSDKTNITIMACGSGSGQMHAPSNGNLQGHQKNKFLMDGGPNGWIIEWVD